MQLLPDDLRAQLPPLYATEGESDPLVVCKFFTPDSSWTWYATEAGDVDGDYLFFGLVDGHEAELGYFSLLELENARGPLGLRIERDLWWKPTRLSAVRKELGR